MSAREKTTPKPETVAAWLRVLRAADRKRRGRQLPYGSLEQWVARTGPEEFSVIGVYCCPEALRLPGHSCGVVDDLDATLGIVVPTLHEARDFSQRALRQAAAATGREPVVARASGRPTRTA